MVSISFAGRTEQSVQEASPIRVVMHERDSISYVSTSRILLIFSTAPPGTIRDTTLPPALLDRRLFQERALPLPTPLDQVQHPDRPGPRSIEPAHLARYDQPPSSALPDLVGYGPGHFLRSQHGS